MALLTLEIVTKLFRRGDEEIRAIDDLSLSIGEGEFLAITGSSGSGKSTLLYILGLLDVPTSGRYFLGGEPTESLADDERAKLRNRFMGFVFQSFHLIPRATALRNVMMPLVYSSSYGTVIAESEQRARAEEALRVVNLSDRMSHRPNELSGGQRQRVAIARALVNNPRVLFADEPTGNLDPATTVGIMRILDRINRTGTTVVMATHDQRIVDAMRRRVVELDRGSLVRDQVRGIYGTGG
jgi:putative ABC transport system ATP-binding protein